MFKKLKIGSNWLSGLCFMAAVILISIILVRKDMVDKHQSAYIEQYKTKQRIGEIKSELPDTTKMLTEEIENGSQEVVPIGILYIPKIDLEAAVLQGVNPKTLRYAVGHYENTPLPSEGGNSCIVGHRSYSYGAFFNRLDEIELNDKIEMEVSGKTYYYNVKDILVVKPEEVWVLDATEETMITLITCTPIRIGTHRLIIRAILEKVN